MTVHVVLVPQPVTPAHPTNAEPLAGDAVSVMGVLTFTVAVHVPGQLMPPTLLATVPAPAPVTFTVSANAFNVNVAATACVAFTFTTQAPAPEHSAPLQPVNNEFASGVAVSVTDVPTVNVAGALEQFVPQLIAPTSLVTEPVPFPDLLTVSAKLFNRNVAVTFFAPVIVTVHVAPLPQSVAPAQPVKSEFASAAAVSVTDEPVSKLASALEQPEPHLMAIGALVTVPPPVPALVIVIANCFRVNAVVTFCAAFIVTVHAVLVPQPGAPVQPAKSEFKSGAAVNVTDEPTLYVAEQAGPQLTPSGVLITNPLPFPPLLTVMENVT